jgi:hypothetical protein
MIHHDDSTALKPTRLNSHSKEVLRRRANMVPQARQSDIDNQPICKSHPVPRLPLLGRQATDSRSMALDKGYSMAYSKARYSIVKTFRRHNRKGSLRNLTHSTAYTAWRNHRRHNHRTNRSHSTDRVPFLLLRHTAPLSECHNRRNITLQRPLVKRACLHLNSRHNKCLHSIYYPTRILKLALQARKPIPVL